MKSVLIMGTDEHARAVQGALAASNVDAFCFNSQWPFELLGCTGDITLKIEGRSFNDQNVGALYWRSHDGVTAETDLDRTNRLSLFNSFLLQLSFLNEVPCFNSYEAWTVHKTKPFQNAIVDTDLFEDNVVMAIDVYNRTVDLGASIPNVVAKRPQGGEFARCPSLYDNVTGDWTFQKRCEGITFRVYVIGDRTFWYHMVFDEGRYVDYREDKGCQSILLKEESAQSLSFNDVLRHVVNDSLDWRWAGLDVVFNPNDGVLTILDINPSPMFLGFQEKNEILLALAGEIQKEML